MDLRIFDKQLNALGVIDEAASVIWTVRYFDVGEFKILAPITDNNRELLVRDRVVVKHDKYTDYTDADGAIWRRGAVIKEQIEATGYGLSKWLSQRVIAPTFSTTGTKQAIVNELVTRNIGSKADTARQFPQFITITQSDFGGVSIDYSPEYLKDLGDEVKAQCQDGKLGYDILVNESMRAEISPTETPMAIRRVFFHVISIMSRNRSTRTVSKTIKISPTSAGPQTATTSR